MTKTNLLNLNHVNHKQAFIDYALGKSLRIKDKQKFLRKYIEPQPNDIILECGCSSGKTAIDLIRHSGCQVIGVDFSEAGINIGKKLLDKHFPKIKQKCTLIVDDLTTMNFDRRINKIVMADFTEHITNKTLTKILNNMRKQIPNAKIYIYTPNRTHIFEILKHRELILKNEEGHINVKSRAELTSFLKKNKITVQSIIDVPSYLPFFRCIEYILSNAPCIGKLFCRKMALIGNFQK